MAGGMFLALSSVALASEEAHAQVIWEPLVIDHNNSKEADAAPSGIWDSVPERQQNKPPITPLVWEVIPDNEQNNLSLNQIIWQVIADDEVSPNPPAEASRKLFDQHLTLEQVEVVLNNIPLNKKE